jgi:hypothetical protein
MDTPTKDSPVEKRTYNTKPVKRIKNRKELKEKRKRDYNDQMATVLVVPRGRPRKFTRTTLRNRINDYFEFVQGQTHKNGKPFVPSIRGLCRYLNIDKDSWYGSYCVYEETKELCKQTMSAIEDWFVQDLYNEEKSNTNKQLVIKQELGWTDKQEIVQEVRLTPETALAKLERLAPFLLEAVQRGETPLKNLIDVTPKNTLEHIQPTP